MEVRKRPEQFLVTDQIQVDTSFSKSAKGITTVLIRLRDNCFAPAICDEKKVTGKKNAKKSKPQILLAKRHRIKEDSAYEIRTIAIKMIQKKSRDLLKIIREKQISLTYESIRALIGKGLDYEYNEKKFKLIEGRVAEQFGKEELRKLDVETTKRLIDQCQMQGYQINVAWRYLASVLHYAQDMGFISDGQVLDEHIKKLKAPENLEGKVRNSLSPQALTGLEELFKNEISGQTSYGGKKLGIAIMMFTGMTENEVCGLTWGDYFREGKKETTCCRVFRVSKEFIKPKNAKRGKLVYLQENGSVYGYRFIVLPSVLVSILDERYKNIGKCENSYPIVSEYGKKRERLSTSELRTESEMLRKKYCSESKKQAVVVDGQLLFRVPTFRNNYAYQLEYRCGFETGEIEHMMGRIAPDTDYKTYNDMNSWVNQLRLSVQVDRWASSFEKYLSRDVKKISDVLLCEDDRKYIFRSEKEEQKVHVFEMDLTWNVSSFYIEIPFGGSVTFRLEEEKK